jgi:hypothetical protein
LVHQLVLIYAQSGAGKTSIFNAQVIPSLEEEHGCQVLPVGRVGIPFSPMHQAFLNSEISTPGRSNLYIFNLLQSLSPLNLQIDPQSLVKKSLSDFLKEYFPHDKDESGNLIRQILVIDQLEELFNRYIHNWEKQRVEFFQGLAEALKNDLSLRIILIIREDYLAAMDPFLDILPERLRPRFRLERLRKNAAIAAIKGLLKRTNSSILQKFKEEDVDKHIHCLVDNLLQIRLEDPVTGKISKVEGEYVEPIELQIVCQKWWQDRFSSKNTMKSLPVNEIDVDNALEDFYVSAVYYAAKNTGVSEDDIREWCEQKLITSNGTRTLVHKEKETTANMSNTVLDFLEHMYLIRREFHAGAACYELTHDRLIGAILNANRRYYRKKFRRRFKDILLGKK